MINNICWEGNNVRVAFEGNVFFEDIFQVDGKIIGDSRFDLTKYIVYDLRKVTILNLTKNELAAISTLDISASRWNAKLKLAILGKDKLIIELAENYIIKMNNNNWEVKIFENLDKALVWCMK